MSIQLVGKVRDPQGVREYEHPEFGTQITQSYKLFQAHHSADEKYPAVIEASQALFAALDAAVSDGKPRVLECRPVVRPTKKGGHWVLFKVTNVAPVG